MSTKIKELKSTLGIGARANQFRIMIAAPAGISDGPDDDNNIDTLCKGTSIPGKTMGEIEVVARGTRKFMLPSVEDFDRTWTLTFYSTEGHDLYKKFDNWIKYLDSTKANGRGTGDTNAMMTDGARVEQLSSVDGSVTATFEFYDMWPKSISSIEMGNSSSDEIEEFTVDMTFSYWESV